VLATDASLQMVRMAEQKARRAGCADRVRFLWLPMEQLAHQLSGESFDGVYSNFGAINCAAEPQWLGRDLARLVPAGAPLALVVMGRYVPWEWAWYLARGDARSAFRRLGRSGVAWRGLDVRYPTPGSLRRALAPHFATSEVAPMGFALPGSYAAGFLEQAPRTLATLTRLERFAQRGGLLAACADHYYLQARRAA